MQAATITCAYVNQPKSTKGPGSVKDSNGNYWKCWQETLPQFQAGGTYEITFEAGSYKGKPDNTVLTVKPSGTQVMPVAGIKSNPAAAPVQTIKPMGMTKDEQIFVQGFGQAQIRNPGFDPALLNTLAGRIAFVNGWRDAYRNTFGGQQIDPELNDEIVFK